MKILAFVVRVECQACEGAKRLRARVDDPNGETLACVRCDGIGHVEAVVDFADFEKLVHGIARVASGPTTFPSRFR